jgi:hypothetical protein
MKWVIINKNAITKKIKAGQIERELPNGQALIRVNENNEEYLTDFIKYSIEEILALDLKEKKTLHNSYHSRSKDNSNRNFTRLAITEEGWSFLAHFIECKTSTINGVYCENYNGQVEAQHYAKFYNELGEEITEELGMVNCVKSVFTIIPNIDYEVVSGEIHQYVRPETNARLHSLIGAFLPDGSPLSVKEFVRNLNLKFKDKAKAIVTDGRAPKLLRKDYAGLPFDANQIQIVINHEAGLKHEIMVELEYYRE